MPQTDPRHMARAIQLAERSLFIADPNPRVGCVLVKGGEVIGEGWTQAPGGDHAEIQALNNARTSQQDPRGATAYVSLEPCCFTGLTGPCTSALIEAGIVSVVYAMEDPNPKVAGQGLEQLKAAGIEIHGPLMEDSARSINPGFIKRMSSGIPFVRVKMAMSLDGRTAMGSGESKWITSPPARKDVQQWRARSSAIVTGIETVLHDNPELNVRPEELALAPPVCRQPLRVVLDSEGRMPNNARIKTVDGNLLHVVSENGDSSIGSSDEAYQRIAMPTKKGKIDLVPLLCRLAELNCNEVLVEAGATLAGEFLQQGLVDELIIYIAPKLMGSNARPLFNLPLDTMAAQLGLQIHDVRAFGQDWRVIATTDPEA